MKFSYCMLPDYPLDDSIEMIKTADQLGYYACYAVDETWHKDLWVLFAAAADKTERIRFGPNVTHVFLREPTLICQQVATLDELTGGRTELVVSTGNKSELAVGYSHSVVLKPRPGISFEVPAPTQVIVKGTDKQQVGQTAAEVRAVRPPEPYKGKGIRYRDEVVRRKVGKRAT